MTIMTSGETTREADPCARAVAVRSRSRQTVREADPHAVLPRSRQTALLLAFGVAVGCAASDPPSSPAPDPRTSSASSTGGVSESRESESNFPPGGWGDSAEVSGPRIAPILSLSPSDTRTAVGRDAPILATFDRRVDDMDLLNAVASALELRSYPDLARIPTEAVISVVPSSGGVGSQVRLVPKSELPSSWYVLSLASIPAGVQVAPWSAPSPPAGVYASRFHTDSSPVVSQLRFCDKEGGVLVIVVDFSEPVQTADFGTLIELEQDGKTCTPLPVNVPFADSDEKVCTGISKAAPLHFELREGLASESHVPVRTMAGALTMAETFELAKLPAVETGCVGWRP